MQPSNQSKNPVTSFRLPEPTRNQIDELAAKWGCSMANIVTLAIDRMYQQEIHQMQITGINYEDYKAKFGTVVHEGKLYWLTDVADFSNRPFTGWWGDAQEGEAYTAEFSCNAVDGAGDEYQVYWQFDAVKGEELADNGNWPWDEEHITRVVAQ